MLRFIPFLSLQHASTTSTKSSATTTLAYLDVCVQVLSDGHAVEQGKVRVRGRNRTERWDGYCVPYRDCVFRTHKPDKLLSLNEDLVMVGTSTTIFDQNTLKCFVSKQIEPVYYNYHRSVNYQVYAEGRWQNRSYELKMITEYYGERIIAEDEYDRLPYGIDGFPSSSCRRTLHYSCTAAA
ncbi:hypothetical protein MTO96_006655 [Rhipicephalus appendiculatus]